jgi:Flp pilus assembly pilin Flp
MKKLIDFIKNDEGVTVPEYALMLAVIAGVVTAAVLAIGTNSSTRFQTTADTIAAP